MDRSAIDAATGCREVLSGLIHVVPFGSAEHVYRDLPLNFFMDRYTASCITEMESFIAAVEGDTRCDPTGHDGRMSVAVARAARRSLQENRPVLVSEVG